MLYKFSIADPYNYTKEQIMEEALIFTQNEFDLLSITDLPSIELVSESTKNDEKIYHFIAKRMAEPINLDQDSEGTTPKLRTDNDTVAASSLSL